MPPTITDIRPQLPQFSVQFNTMFYSLLYKVVSKGLFHLLTSASALKQIKSSHSLNKSEDWMGWTLAEDIRGDNVIIIISPEIVRIRSDGKLVGSDLLN